jgi:hypothetical protein
MSIWLPSSETRIDYSKKYRFHTKTKFSPYICMATLWQPAAAGRIPYIIDVLNPNSISRTYMEKDKPGPKSRGREKYDSSDKDYRLATHDGCKKRRSRRKPFLLWEQADLASNGFYARKLEEVEAKFPKLTRMQCRVCALVKAMLPSWRIAEILGITEKTVENHRHNAHPALGLQPNARIEEALK